MHIREVYLQIPKIRNLSIKKVPLPVLSLKSMQLRIFTQQICRQMRTETETSIMQKVIWLQPL